MAGIEGYLKNESKSSSDKASKRKKHAVKAEDDEYDDDDASGTPPPTKKSNKEKASIRYTPSKQTAKTTKAKTTSRKSKTDDQDSVMAEVTQQPGASKSTAPHTAKSKSQSKSGKDENDNDDDFVQPKAEKKPSARSGYYKMLHRAPPSALGTRPKPVGSDGCLTNMTFVLSGEFETITKDDITDIIKTYGGRVTSAVSGKTTYLVRGRDAGQSKLDKANSLKTKILDEDGFYDIVEKSAGKPQPEKKESSKAQPTRLQPGNTSAASSKKLPLQSIQKTATKESTDDTLWTEKYKPKSTAEIIGNKGVIAKLSSWLADWQDNHKKNFPHSNGTSQGFRAVLLSGPPGIGKTTTAQLLAKEHGYTAMELNASDTRNKSILGQLVSETTNNRSMTEFFASDTPGSNNKLKEPKSGHGRLVLIMDEVDGMSGGDRGGSAELARLIRSTNIPIICVCNDARSDKVKPLLKVCFEAKFIRTPARSLRNRFMAIAQKENLDIEPNALDELVSATGNDIRQILNILSTYRLCSNDMKFGDAKNIGSQNQKYSQISLFNIPVELLGKSRWQHPNMNQLADIYFHDYDLAHLMIFENYTLPSPALALESVNPKERECLEMDLVAQASNAISDGDLVDNRIRSNQEFSLMPVHSIFSCVRPAYYVHGNLAGNRIGFPQSLGQFSKTTKNRRLLADIQNKLRSKATVDLLEVRQHYVPALTCNLFTGIANGDNERAMDIMDYYYLDRENLETLSDIALSGKAPMNTLSANAKRNFNKAYKGRVHPILFQFSDTSPLKSKTKTTAEDMEGAIFDVEPEADVVSDSE